MRSTARWGIISGYGRQLDMISGCANHYGRHVVGAYHDHHRLHDARLGFREIGAFGLAKVHPDEERSRTISSRSPGSAATSPERTILHLATWSCGVDCHE